MMMMMTTMMMMMMMMMRDSILAQGAPLQYVQILAGLYAEQYGRVKGRGTSKRFSIQRGTKQGDPMSPMLFNSVLQHALEPLQKKWREKGWGVQVGSGQSNLLCNLRFADDIILLSTSKKQLLNMLEDVVHACQSVGLQMHPDKSKLFCNAHAGCSRTR
eukprot:6196662-Karenia_brevis.AAC.1